MTMAIRLTPELVQWVQERLGTDADEAQNFTKEFSGMLYFTGAFAESERLAAAAPDLLEACEVVHSILSNKLKRPRSPLEQVTIDKLAKAIAKAKGQ